MDPHGSVLFSSRGTFTEAILTAVAAGRHDMTIADRDFRDWPFETRAGDERLAAFLQGEPRSRLRLLVADPTWLERHAPRFAKLRQQHRGAIACRQIPAEFYRGESVLIADRCHLLRRAHHGLFRGRLTLGAPAEVEPVATRYDALWNESTDCLGPTTLGL
jgi:hypothetical protein